MNRRCRVFDRPEDSNARGLIGTITAIYDEFNFRFVTDNGNEYEFSTKVVTVQFLGES